MHYSPLGWYQDSPCSALAMLWNTQNTTLTANVTMPLYYAGFSSSSVAAVRVGDGEVVNVTLSAFNASVLVQLPPLGVTYVTVSHIAAAR